jgi:hypothetical protein
MSGSLVRSTATFKDITGALADPNTLTVKYQAGSADAVDVSGDVVHDSTGVYHYDYDTTGFTGPGTQTVTIEWFGTGTVQAINADTWAVSPAPI